MGGISFNKEAVKAKLKASLNSPEGKKKIAMAGENAIRTKSGIISGLDSAHTPEEAAQKFLEVLQSSIRSSGLSAGVIDAVSNWKAPGSSTRLGDGHYAISVNFAGEEFRFSLDMQKYGGISNIVSLYDSGAKNGGTMRPVHGEWHGKETWSRTVIPGAHFIDSAINEFMANYASKYNVTGITRIDV